METKTIQDFYEIQFPKLGWEFHINPTAFTIFGLDIQWYGLIITLGLALAAIYCFPRMKRFGIDSDKAVDAVLGGIIGGVIGARTYYVIMKWENYQKGNFKDSFLAMINTRNGGLAIYGGIIGALAVGLLICRLKKIKILPMLDVAVLGLLIGQGIGRWGNFVNQEAFGTNTDFFLGMTGGRIQHAINEGMQMGGDMYANGLDMLWDKPVHPCFLYESVWCLLGFVLLAFMSKRRKYDGQLMLMYMTWYGLERAIVEGLRTDSLMIGSIRVSQAVSVIIFIVSVILQIVIGFRVKRDPERYVLYAATEESLRMIEEARRKKTGMKGIDAYHSDDDDDIDIFTDDDDEDNENGEDDKYDENDEDGKDGGFEESDEAEERIEAEDDESEKTEEETELEENTENDKKPESEKDTETDENEEDK